MSGCIFFYRQPAAEQPDVAELVCDGPVNQRGVKNKLNLWREGRKHVSPRHATQPHPNMKKKKNPMVKADKQSCGSGLFCCCNKLYVSAFF